MSTLDDQVAELSREVRNLHESVDQLRQSLEIIAGMWTPAPPRAITASEAARVLRACRAPKPGSLFDAVGGKA